MFNNKVFNITDSNIIFVSDYYSNEYEGGAELSTESLFVENKSNLKVLKIKASNLSLEDIKKYKNKTWVFFNCATIDYNLLQIFINSSIKYAVVEYDYKFCKFRSPAKHIFEENNCNCQDSEFGKFWELFLLSSKHVFWMSEQQANLYKEKFPKLNYINQSVLSSVFDSSFFRKIELLKNNKKSNSYVVLKSPSWVKGYESAIEFCKKNNLKYEEVWGLQYDNLLEKLSKSAGLVFLPNGEDTCPRLVIEARLLGCQIVSNENVQHVTEQWFNESQSKENIVKYLKSRPDHFWNEINKINLNKPELSGYMYSYNWIKNDYPWEKSLNSILGFCDEVVVVDAGSDDGTLEILNEISNKNKKLKITIEKIDWSDSRSAVFDGKLKAIARSYCTKDFCWQMDADEIILEKDYQKIRSIIENWQNCIELICLPIIEYWGSKNKVRVDVNPWKWRLSKNLKYITHGIPIGLRKFDNDWKMYAAQGTDGCDYINLIDGKIIPCAQFQNLDKLIQCQQLALNDVDYLKFYEKMMNELANNIPTIRHYSWIDIERKIKFYKNFWQRHWESLYNIKIEDTSDNNMFFNKPWSDVTEKEIKDLAEKLAAITGGHVFHKKFNENSITPWIKINE